MTDERARSFSLFNEQLGKEIPLQWEPIEKAPVNYWPLIVFAVEMVKPEDGHIPTFLLVGGRFGGQWSFTMPVPDNVRLVEFFRVPIPAHILKERAH